MCLLWCYLHMQWDFYDLLLKQCNGEAKEKKKETNARCQGDVY